jgi:hypothetical protein
MILELQLVVIHLATICEISPYSGFVPARLVNVA